MSANTLKDFIEPAVEHYKKKKLDDKIGTIIAKALGQLLCILESTVFDRIFHFSRSVVDFFFVLLFTYG